jgi:hypothetical protein
VDQGVDDVDRRRPARRVASEEEPAASDPKKATAALTPEMGTGMS